MRRMRRIWLIALATLVFAAPAYADATAFIGATTTPVNRSVRGLAVGVGLLAVGFEFEYAVTPSDDRTAAPSLKTGSGNVLLQAPFPIFGAQPYATAGVGLYREAFDDRTETGVTANLGGGVKMALAGPLRLRIDYRVFKLGRGALYSPAHRIYAGLNLRF